MPTIDDIAPKLTKAKVFSVMDAKNGFWQVALDESSSYLTTFWTPMGRYRWCRMPFGLKTASDEFQRRQAQALEGLPGVVTIVDDVLICGSGDTLDQAGNDHDNNLLRLLDRARQKRLVFNASKIRLKLPEVRYCGHIFSAQGIRADPEKVKAITNLSEPKDMKALQRFLGTVNYLARFLPRLSQVCEPLRRLLAKDVEWSWQTQQQAAFDQIKQLVAKHPVLSYYDVSKPVTVQCDASDVGLGAVLLQENTPVAYASRALSSAERQYAQIEKECLAIVFGCERFEQYVYGREDVMIHTDHKPLEMIAIKPLHSAPKRLQRMLLRLQKFDITIRYKKGTDVFIADMLSRAPLDDIRDGDIGVTQHIFQMLDADCFYTELESVNQAESIDGRIAEDRFRRIEEETQQDHSLSQLAQVIQQGFPEKKQDIPVDVREYWPFRDELAVHGKMIFKGQRVLIPRAMRTEMLHRIHYSHLGAEACLRKA